MSEIMPRDILSDLWEEILQRQFQYMEAEDSPQKLEERKKLEGSLKELLCRVRQDRKFFLTETALVLSNSICQNQEFNIKKAITAFEGISQYANNLYSKPWRKEFRILKMYSGFYQHDIKSSLIDAEKLFVAMGYRSLSDDTLILDGPICPDQVSNVFRDAMTAYVELQIMKYIRMELEANDVTVSWLDIFWYREKHVGGTTQAIKDLIYEAQEKRYRSSEKSLPADNYGYIDVQPSPNFFTPSPQCQCSNHYHQPLPRHRITNNGPCCLHEMPSLTPSNMMFGNYSPHNYHNQQSNMSPEAMSHLPQMSHSRSLEHYSEPNHTILPHRHSFDHQQQGCTAAIHHPQHMPQHRSHRSIQPQFYRNASQNYYDPTYDRIDENSVGGSSLSHAAGRGTSGIDVGCPPGVNYNINASTYANPYNVSGNRFPLPYNISNQLSEYDNNPHMGMEPTYARVLDNHMYAQVVKARQNYYMNSDNAGNTVNPYAYGKSMENCNNDSVSRQNSYISEPLINFEDSTIIPPPPATEFDPYQQQYSTQDALRGKRYSKISLAEPNVAANYGASISKTNLNSDEGYAKPIPKECRQSQKNMQSSMDKSTCLRKTSYTSGERGAGDATDLSYESNNDDIRQKQHSPTQFTKNQEGVGSFESWDYVFQNLERSGYNKDLGEREDLVINTLGLDSLNIANDSTTPSQTSSGEKRRSGCKENDNPADVKYKTRSFGPSEKATAVASSAANSYTKQKPQTDNNKQKMKSVLKQPVHGTAATNNKPNTGTNKKNSTMAKSNDNKPKGNNLNDNNNTRFAGKSKPNKKLSVSASAVNSAVKSSTVSTSNDAPTGAKEWSCQFCTLINPGTTRICEVCAHSKDFNVDASPSAAANNTATAQSTVAHNTPTCV